jgi:nucleoside-triphosphatase THEP1
MLIETLTEQDLKIIDEINEMENKRKNIIQTNQNTTWKEIKLWSMSVLAVITFFGCVYMIATNKTALLVFLTMVGVGVIMGLVMGTKILIESAYEEIMENRK